MDVTGLKVLLETLANGATSGTSAGWLTGRVCADSRQVRPGDVFVAVKGVQVDGHNFVADAIARGAKVVVAEKLIKAGEGAIQFIVDDSAQALGELAQVTLGAAGKSLVKIGITGTKGKTTVTYLTQAMLRAAGIGCGVIGTVGYDVGGEMLVSNNTTPGAVELADLMRQMMANGLGAVVMECSSHALEQKRTAGIRFAAAGFTNLAGDHMDYHLTREAYLEAKSRLFRDLDSQAVAVLNAEDEVCDYLASLTKARVWRFAVEGAAEIFGRIRSMDVDGCVFEMDMLGKRVVVKAPLLGRHNVSNCLAAAGLARAAGVEAEVIAGAIETFSGVPGRLERVANDVGITVLVDYAHTEESLRSTLETLRALGPRRRLLVVFGCGGDRDRTKRPRMAHAAEELADQVIVTSDNPRTEDPEAILAEIRAGFSAAGRAKVTEIVDRRQAIEAVLQAAGLGDVVLIAGKGHEDYQIIGTTKYPFDDRVVARAFLQGTHRLCQQETVNKNKLSGV